jgi:hypothetical protein
MWEWRLLFEVTFRLLDRVCRFWISIEGSCKWESFFYRKINSIDNNQYCICCYNAELHYLTRLKGQTEISIVKTHLVPLKANQVWRMECTARLTVIANNIYLKACHSQFVACTNILYEARKQKPEKSSFRKHGLNQGNPLAEKYIRRILWNVWNPRRFASSSSFIWLFRLF